MKEKEPALRRALPSHDQYISALDAARHLAQHGAPLFLARPVIDADGNWDPKGGAGGYRLPGKWQETSADPSVVDRWKPGMALCAVQGHGVDAVDVDLQNGGDQSLEQLPMPRSYGRARTPSGGTHDLIAPLGVGSKDRVLPGIDVKGGRPDGTGRGFIFLAPTRKLSKTTGEIEEYAWETLPDLAAIDPDDQSGAALADMIAAPRAPKKVMAERPQEYIDDSPASEGVHPDAQRLVAGELAKLDALWDGALWDSTSFAIACQLIEIVNSNWTGYALDQAEADFLARAPRDADFDPKHKWRSALKKVGDKGRPAPADPHDDFEVIVVPDDSSWAPLDLMALFDGDYEPPKPTILRRSDGRALLYPGKTHSLSGESGSGKSWVAQNGTLEVLQDGGRALYLDYESSLEDIWDRFVRILGCSREQMSRLDYARPDEAPEGPGFEALLRRSYDLVVIDGVTEALGMSGIRGDSPTNNNDLVTAWHSKFPKRIARAGAAVLQVDHVTKASDSRGEYAIGGQAKRASITGASFIAVCHEPFAVGKSGSVDLYVGKDRGGQVKGAPNGAKKSHGTHVARVSLICSPDDPRVYMYVDPPEPETDRFKQAVVRELGGLPAGHEGLSTNAVRASVTGDSSAISAALNELVSDGFVERTRRGQASLHRLTGKPYIPEFDSE